MIRKKKKQLEREAAEQLADAKDKSLPKLGKEEDIVGLALLNMNGGEINNGDMDGPAMEENATELEEASKGRLDLNSDPHREDEILAEVGMSLNALMNTGAGSPPDVSLEKSGVLASQSTSDVVEESGTVEASTVPQTTYNSVEENGAAVAAGDGEEEKEL